ncbi:hypothetical protein CB1_000533016 [Camelus ferus]|nr:hypothetical protein CB1_000533016 [Camelus ferus]
MDNDPLVFGVSGEEASRFFAVEPDTGVVWLRQPLDRETKSEFTVEFSVSDHQGVITRKVNIQVGDVNDNAPTFHNQPYSVRILEGCVAASLTFSAALSPTPLLPAPPLSSPGVPREGDPGAQVFGQEFGVSEAQDLWSLVTPVPPPSTTLSMQEQETEGAQM